jgi:hypothetical protein
MAEEDWGNVRVGLDFVEWMFRETMEEDLAQYVVGDISERAAGRCEGHEGLPYNVG